MIPNVLAARYASPAMREIWSAESKIESERRLWLAVLSAQRDLGLGVAAEVVADYRRCLGVVDLASIERRERSLRHDVKARIEEWNDLAGHQAIHLGMTSRDLTENVEQLQVRRSLELVRDRAVAALARMAELAGEHAELVVTGRTHNVAAQATTVGKRIAAAGEELLFALEDLESLADRYPLRGIKGPVGTQLDQVELLGSPEAADRLEAAVAEHLGFRSTLGAVGQVYPRSLDLAVVSALVGIVSGPVSLSTTLRLMAGHGLASEGFGEDQVGSSAMPHKMNARSSERMHGLKVVLGGHLAMAVGLAGEQWNEGDVACSVVRRVMLPDAFFAADGLFETFLVVCSEMSFDTEAISAEVFDQLPFLATTKLLAAAVKQGAGREEAYEVIRTNAVGGRAGELLDRLAGDDRFPLGKAAIDEAVGEPLSFTGRAGEQVEAFVERVGGVVSRHPEAAGYRPSQIL